MVVDLLRESIKTSLRMDAANQNPVEPERFGNRLGELIEANDGSQAWLAEVTGLGRSTISRLVRGERSPSPTTLERLAPALDCSVADLVEGTDAEAQLEPARRVVPTSQHAQVIEQLAQAGRQRDEAQEQLAAERRRRIEAEKALGDVHGRLESSQADVRRAREVQRELEMDLRAEKARCSGLKERLKLHERALARAAACIEELKQQVAELTHEIKEAGQSARRASIFAGVAAGGAVTVATLLAWARTGANGAPDPDADERQDHDDEVET